ncbi:Hypothetical protein, putative [Bodo saltans]|uniref:Uncharacterized protein n=1 Tax=Bodo saltans TaxID=75058 RepID=A0A0S4JL19_BODSA|nr:Hypothetical protein, putative [Bodo saltans]|eukprot:CUG90617.1 Hypothetical protein, putative [Bodo saltans]
MDENDEDEVVSLMETLTKTYPVSRSFLGDVALRLEMILDALEPQFGVIDEKGYNNMDISRRSDAVLSMSMSMSVTTVWISADDPMLPPCCPCLCPCHTTIRVPTTMGSFFANS